MNSYLLFKSLAFNSCYFVDGWLLYLPRIFVYHVENNEKKQATDILKLWKKDFIFIL